MSAVSASKTFINVDISPEFKSTIVSALKAQLARFQRDKTDHCSTTPISLVIKLNDEIAKIQELLYILGERTYQ